MEKEVIYEFDYLYMDTVCSHVVVYKGGTATVENFTDSIIHRAFGMKEDNIGVEDLDDLLEYRCFPKSRVNCREILESAGLDEYDEMSIIRKTHGVMTDDCFWIRFVGEDLCYDDVRVH